MRATLPRLRSNSPPRPAGPAPQRVPFLDTILIRAIAAHTTSDKKRTASPTGLPWHRVVRANGTFAPHIAAEQAARLRVEGVLATDGRVPPEHRPRR